MSRSTIRHLVLLLAETPDPCAVCGQARFAIGFRIYERHLDDSEVYHGSAICPACAAGHGYHGAVLQALAVEETRTLAAEASFVAAGLEGSERLVEARAGFDHLRRLIAADRLDTPPAIELEHVDPAPSELRAALAFYERHVGTA